MKTRKRIGTWVVYLRTIHGKPLGVNAVCEQREWEELERERPGYHTLVRGGFTNEADAERAARGTSGDSFRGGARPSTRRTPQPASRPQG